MLKRAFDIVLSATALLILLVPGVVVVIILKCTGERKAWYLQDRVGRGGKIFKVFKFVTMREGSEFIGTGDLTVRDDPRVLPVGRVLRKTKINELPQIINVLKGDMSIVGPRPLVPRGFGYYPLEIQEKIKTVKPGLTGLGSIVFRDEEAIVSSGQEDPRTLQIQYIAPYKGALESWYIDHQNFWLDLRIVFLTAWVILFPTSRLYEKWLRGFPSKPDDLDRLADRT